MIDVFHGIDLKSKGFASVDTSYSLVLEFFARLPEDSITQSFQCAPHSSKMPHQKINGDTSAALALLLLSNEFPKKQIQ